MIDAAGGYTTRFVHKSARATGRLTTLFIASASLALPITGQAQAVFERLPMGWQSPHAERMERVELEQATRALEESPAAGTMSAQALLTFLAHADTLHARAVWHFYYWYLRAADDTQDEASAIESAKVSALDDRVTGAVQARLEHLTPAQLRHLEHESPRLRAYEGLWEDAQAARRTPDPTVLPLVTVATSWQDRLTSHLSRADSLTKRELLAFTLLETARSRMAVAKLNGYADAPAQAYASRHATVAEVRTLYELVRSHAGIFRRYSELAKVVARDSTLRAHPVSAADVPRAIVEAMSPMGSRYRNELAAVLDLSNGRLDIGPGTHRKSGGFSFMLRGNVTGVYLDSVAGTPRSISRLAHESAHAVHKSLFRHGSAPYLYSPAFSEAVALFQEIVVAEHFANAATQHAASVAWRGQELDKLMEVFYGAWDAELEQRVYDGVASGTLYGPGDLDSLTGKVDSSYVPANAATPSTRWMRVGQMIDNPLYLSNYLYSGLIALAMYDAYHAAPQQFASRYVFFLQDYGTADPKATLKRTLGIDLDDDAVRARAFALLEHALADYQVAVGRL